MIAGSTDDELVGRRVEPGGRAGQAVLGLVDARAAGVGGCQGDGHVAVVPGRVGVIAHDRLAGEDGHRAGAGVAGVAGLKKAITQGLVKPGESAVVVITGNGLKDVQSAKQAAGKALEIEPDFQVLEKQLSRLSLI